jgi:hypothetical protein
MTLRKIAKKFLGKTRDPEGWTLFRGDPTRWEGYGTGYGRSMAPSATQYGATNPAEWFAEHSALHLRHPEVLKKRMPEVDKFFATINRRYKRYVKEKKVSTWS